jgi:hypothetical protein
MGMLSRQRDLAAVRIPMPRFLERDMAANETRA